MTVLVPQSIYRYMSSKHCTQKLCRKTSFRNKVLFSKESSLLVRQAYGTGSSEFRTALREFSEFKLKTKQKKQNRTEEFRKPTHGRLPQSANLLSDDSMRRNLLKSPNVNNENCSNLFFLLPWTNHSFWLELTQFNSIQSSQKAYYHQSNTVVQYLQKKRMLTAKLDCRAPTRQSWTGIKLSEIRIRTNMALHRFRIHKQEQNNLSQPTFSQSRSHHGLVCLLATPLLQTRVSALSYFVVWSVIRNFGEIQTVSK